MIVDKQLIGKKVEQVIDGRKLYKWIKAQINPYGKPFEGTVFEFGNKVMEHIEAMENQPQADKWIPCTTNCELPYNGQKVWISFANEVCSYVKQAWWIYDHFEWNNGKRVKDYPIAWQPFITPQPYKKEGAE